MSKPIQPVIPLAVFPCSVWPWLQNNLFLPHHKSTHSDHRLLSQWTASPRLASSFLLQAPSNLRNKKDYAHLRHLYSWSLKQFQLDTRALHSPSNPPPPPIVTLQYVRRVLRAALPWLCLVIVVVIGRQHICAVGRDKQVNVHLYSIVFSKPHVLERDGRTNMNTGWQWLQLAAWNTERICYWCGQF